MKILILGASGMLGHEVARTLAEDFGHDIHGTVRNGGVKSKLAPAVAANLITGVDVLDADALAAVVERTRPDVIVNCIGLVKQFSSANDPLAALPINAMLPHRLDRLASLVGARLIHISTDCVFAGDKGNYTEADESDARDLYGKSKYIGEVASENAITLRTSIIGHDIYGATEGLVEWFLAQSGEVRGFTKAIFSGLTTRELACVIGERVLKQPELSGLYHVSVDPISKFDLLKLVRDVYGVSTTVIEDARLVIDRSLNSERFRAATGYAPPDWPQLIEAMYRRSRFA